jgi:hypothetical protein
MTRVTSDRAMRLIAARLGLRKGRLHLLREAELRPRGQTTSRLRASTWYEEDESDQEVMWTLHDLVREGKTTEGCKLGYTLAANSHQVGSVAYNPCSPRCDHRFRGPKPQLLSREQLVFSGLVAVRVAPSS